MAAHIDIPSVVEYILPVGSRSEARRSRRQTKSESAQDYQRSPRGRRDRLAYVLWTPPYEFKIVATLQTMGETWFGGTMPLDDVFRPMVPEIILGSTVEGFEIEIR